MSQTDSYTDVVELCAILECLGFTIKSLDTSGDANTTQDGGTRTVVINCPTSGLHVILESACIPCTCPTANDQNKDFWQVSGIAGGKPQNKETGSKLLGSLPKAYRERLSKELQDMVRSIKEHNDSDFDKPSVNRSASVVELCNKSASIVDLVKEGINKSASMIELGSPEKRQQHLKVDTPTRYRSLDTLTAAKEGLPQARLYQQVANHEKGDDKDSFLAHRQSTYTISTPGSVRRRNKTSSPIHSTASNLLDSLIAAEKAAEELRNKLARLIKEFMDEEKNDSSMCSLVLDVSKISVLKGLETSKTQFASSPNLSSLVARDDLPKSKLKRFESVSTSNLGPKAISDKTSKFNRMTPNLLKNKNSSLKGEKVLDGKSKLQSLFKAKIATPVRIPNVKPEGSPNLGASKKKFSHVKSTIPRPTSKKD